MDTLPTLEQEKVSHCHFRSKNAANKWYGITQRNKIEVSEYLQALY